MVDVSILQRSLAILESMVLNSHSLYHRVAQEITVGQLIGHLQVWAHTHAQRHSHALWYGGQAGGREGGQTCAAGSLGAESAAVCQWRANEMKPTMSYCLGSFDFLSDMGLFQNVVCTASYAHWNFPPAAAICPLAPWFCKAISQMVEGWLPRMKVLARFKCPVWHHNGLLYATFWRTLSDKWSSQKMDGLFSFLDSPFTD